MPNQWGEHDKLAKTRGGLGIHAAVLDRDFGPLLQVQKLHNTPLILAGKMWAELVDWCRRSMLRTDFPLASPADMTIPVCVEDGPAIVRVIREHHAAWQFAQGRPAREG